MLDSLQMCGCGCTFNCDRQQKRASKVYRVRDIEEAIATVGLVIDKLKPGKTLSLPKLYKRAVDAMRQIMSYEL